MFNLLIFGQIFRVGRLALAWLSLPTASKLQENRTTEPSSRFLWDLSEIGERPDVGLKKHSVDITYDLRDLYGDICPMKSETLNKVRDMPQEIAPKPFDIRG